MNYTVTIIRLNATTLKFENTEYNSIMQTTDVVKCLTEIGSEYDQNDKFAELKVGSNTTINATKDGKLRFAYIFRIN